MKRALGIGLLCVWMGTGTIPAQKTITTLEAKSTRAPAAEQKASAKTTDDAKTASASVTNEAPPPAYTVPEDIRPHIIARFPFDVNEGADPLSGGAIPVLFKRDSAAYADGQLFDINTPRLVKGKFGKGLLLEESHANLLSKSQADAEDDTPSEAPGGSLLRRSSFSYGGQEPWDNLLRPSRPAILTRHSLATPVPPRGPYSVRQPTDGEGGKPQGFLAKEGEFMPLKDTILSLTTNEHWQGKQSLKVETPGTNGEEGVAIEAKVEKAFYDGNQIVAAHYVASVYLKGAGTLMLSLKEPGIETPTEPVYIDLNATEWKRFSCTYSTTFPAKTIGPKHEADWKSFLPADSNLEVKLQFVCSTIDKQQMRFFADGFQLEQRRLPFAGQGPGLSPHSWTPGKTTAAQDEFSFSTKSDDFTSWKKEGSISFWFKPNWDVRDGTQELMLYLSPSILYLQHDDTKIRFQPAGVEFKPYDWKDNWHHIAITWNEEGRRVLYVDGYDYVNAQGELSPLSDTTDFLALNYTGNGTSPNGIVDELILFKGILSLDQIKAIASYDPLNPPKPRTPEEQLAASETPAATNVPSADAPPTKSSGVEAFDLSR